MSYRLHYKGGPRDAKVEETKSVKNVLFCDDEAQLAGLWGSYRLNKIKGQTACMVWIPHPKPAQVQSAQS